MITHVGSRTDSLGRQQPARKPGQKKAAVYAATEAERTRSERLPETLPGLDRETGPSPAPVPVQEAERAV